MINQETPNIKIVLYDKRSTRIFARTFDCGNSTLNSYLKKYAYKDNESVTYIIFNNSVSIGYYTLTCYGIVKKNDLGIEITPAVQIKFFALDKNYQGELYPGKNLKYSELLFSHVLEQISESAHKEFGAGYIILYSVPDAVNFYKKFGFVETPNEFIVSEQKKKEGCIPMWAKILPYQNQE
jgi:GNAT superfamily N-acetyltransferase